MTAFGRLIRNRGTEQDVRGYLQGIGYDGLSARLEHLELVAVERPGWVQIFRFGVRVVNDRDEVCHYLGVVRGDERNDIRVVLSDTESEQKRVIAKWSQGLISLNRDRSRLTPFLLAAFVVFLSVAIVGAMSSGS